MATQPDLGAVFEGYLRELSNLRSGASDSSRDLLGHTFSALLAKLGVSNSEMARRVGVTPPTIARWAKGDPPTAMQVERIRRSIASSAPASASGKIDDEIAARMKRAERVCILKPYDQFSSGQWDGAHRDNLIEALREGAAILCIFPKRNVAGEHSFGRLLRALEEHPPEWQRRLKGLSLESHQSWCLGFQTLVLMDLGKSSKELRWHGFMDLAAPNLVSDDYERVNSSWQRLAPRYVAESWEMIEETELWPMDLRPERAAEVNPDSGNRS